MSNLAQTSTARWFDPTNAAYATIGTFPNSGTQSFNTPGNNSAGSTDWVLMIEGGGGSGGSDGGADAGTDGGLDAGADGGLDAGTDAGSTADAGNDGGPDAGLQSDAGGTGSTQVSCGCSQQPLDASWLIVFLLALALRRRPALRPRR
jgi:hypothetical protein